ncbi:hypothetical protein ACKWTF_005618 [Chironomus riparius]
MDFLSSQWLLLKILDICGFFTFNVEKLSSTRKKLFYNILMSVGGTIGAFTVAILYSQSSDEFLNDYSTVTSTIHNSEMSTNIINHLIIVFVTLFRIKELKEFFRKFKVLEGKIFRLKFSEMELEKYYIKNRSNIVYIVSIYTIYFGSLLLIYDTVLTIDESLSHVLLSTMYMFFACYFTTISLFLFYQVEALCTFLSIVNKNLKCLVTSSSFFTEHRISELFIIIFEIQDLINLWSKSFGLTAFGFFVFTFGVLSAEIYFSFATFYFSNIWQASDIYYLYNFCDIIWCLPVIGALSSIGFSCSNFYYELEISSRILRKNSENCDKHVKDSIEKFFIHFNRADFYFTANEFFNLDGSILYKVTVL